MDHYETLGVDIDATPQEIKKAFRDLSKKHHPDVGGEEEDFRRIVEAYTVLSDADKREFYDIYGDTDPNIQKSFDAALAELVVKALDQAGDAMKNCLNILTNAGRGLDEDEKRCHKKKEKLERKMGRVTCKARRDPVSDYLRSKIGDIEAELSHIDRARQTSEYITKNLENYLFAEADEPEVGVWASDWAQLIAGHNKKWTTDT